MSWLRRRSSGRPTISSNIVGSAPIERENFVRVYLLDTPIDLISREETIARAVATMKARVPLIHVAINVAKFVKMRTDPELHRDVTGGDIIGLDGMGLAIVLRLFGQGKVERVPGVDLMYALLEESARQ